MNRVDDINPIVPPWPTRPSDADAERRRRPAPDPTDKPNKHDKDDDETNHVDEYASGDH